MKRENTEINEANSSGTHEKDIKFKKKSKNATFFAIIGHYLKRHPMTAFWIVFLTALSATAAVFGPKIIQNIMANLMAPLSIKQIFLALDLQGKTSLSVTEINQILSDTSSGFYYIGSDVTFTNTTDLINQLSSDSKQFATNLFGLKLTWMHWIYLQLGLFGLTAVSTFLSNYVAGIMGKDIEIELRNKSLEKLVKQDMSYYSDKKLEKS
ncbi:ABC transporter ATP-binding protein [Spiroplasma clarkii]|uniref:ABC transporter transmembrane domain-containing protein n=1 Tax=Spiroplasma clarkii TaxID=2139 RepID=UPI000B5812EE|nr:ABC transporter transmembrane domain-containing protein [Spiroplasma clarkii]ARU91192.1 ABC transporter ATP-binding protein [Spiroplasma clarkii]